MKPCERIIIHVEINASRTFLSPFTKGTRALVFVIRLVSFSGPNGHHWKKRFVSQYKYTHSSCPKACTLNVVHKYADQISAIMKPCERYLSHVEINASRTFLSPFTKGTRALVFVIRFVSFSGPNGHHLKKAIIQQKMLTSWLLLPVSGIYF